MLCYAMLCYAVLCCAVPCHAMPCHAMPCYAMLCYAVLRHAVPCCAGTGMPHAHMHQHFVANPKHVSNLRPSIGYHIADAKRKCSGFFYFCAASTYRFDSGRKTRLHTEPLSTELLRWCNVVMREMPSAWSPQTCCSLPWTQHKLP